MIAIHRLTDRRFAPWKNGGGQTAEIICQPPGAGIDDFAWRISTARVAASGPFSTFPGVARTLCVLEGGPMVLAFDDGRTETVTEASGPVRFSGDIGCQATLTGTALLDLNVMCRAPYCCHVGPTWSETPKQVVARYLLALADGAGLSRYDLVELDPHQPPPAAAGLCIDILKG